MMVLSWMGVGGGGWVWVVVMEVESWRVRVGVWLLGAPHPIPFAISFVPSLPEKELRCSQKIIAF
jgi:hypothetical protein